MILTPNRLVFFSILLNTACFAEKQRPSIWCDLTWYPPTTPEIEASTLPWDHWGNKIYKVLAHTKFIHHLERTRHINLPLNSNKSRTVTLAKSKFIFFSNFEHLAIPVKHGWSSIFCSIYFHIFIILYNFQSKITLLWHWTTCSEFQSGFNWNRIN